MSKDNLKTNQHKSMNDLRQHHSANVTMRILSDIKWNALELSADPQFTIRMNHSRTNWECNLVYIAENSHDINLTTYHAYLIIF
jgi:hypothetical protein